MLFGVLQRTLITPKMPFGGAFFSIISESLRQAISTDIKNKKYTNFYLFNIFEKAKKSTLKLSFFHMPFFPSHHFLSENYKPPT
jgi:hypothetical protein